MDSTEVNQFLKGCDLIELSLHLETIVDRLKSKGQVIALDNSLDDCMLVIQVPKGANQEKLFKTFHKILPRKTLLAIVEDPTSIRQFPEDMMAQYGWFRHRQR